MGIAPRLLRFFRDVCVIVTSYMVFGIITGVGPIWGPPTPSMNGLGLFWGSALAGAIWMLIGKIFESITNSIASASLDTELAKAIQERQSKKK